MGMPKNTMEGSGGAGEGAAEPARQKALEHPPASVRTEPPDPATTEAVRERLAEAARESGVTQTPGAKESLTESPAQEAFLAKIGKQYDRTPKHQRTAAREPNPNHQFADVMTQKRIADSQREKVVAFGLAPLFAAFTYGAGLLSAGASGAAVVSLAPAALTVGGGVLLVAAGMRLKHIIGNAQLKAKAKKLGITASW